MVAVVVLAGGPAYAGQNANSISVSPSVVPAGGTVATPGEELWVKRYNGPGNGNDGGTSGAVSPDGSTVFVTGGSCGSGTDCDYATLAYDASTGAQLWAKRYNGPGNGFDWARALGVSPDGSTVFVTGRSPGSGTGVDYATLAYDASTGAKLWVKRYNGPGNNSDLAAALGVSPH